jgi:hypothetical protein
MRDVAERFERQAVSHFIFDQRFILGKLGKSVPVYYFAGKVCFTLNPTLQNAHCFFLSIIFAREGARDSMRSDEPSYTSSRRYRDSACVVSP